ncbi:basic phospholipase A2 PA-12A [Dermacentor albipictus]|uniref:basic phospholipase A2 PA-12A n=1 Tax=Dermacentor albipictus TaxID=60249 RepID=UPI0038FBEE18
MYQLTWTKRARGPLRLALVLGLALLTLILAGLLSAMSERRALSRRRSESGGGLLLKKQGAAVRHEGLLLSRVPAEERHRAGARARRSIVQLASMLKCVSGCNPLSYRGYGCFCGYMGDGTPVDHIDSCCLEHDWCYSQSPCSKLSLYLLPYDWHCLTPGLAHCAHPSSLSPHAHCGQQLCQCDLEFANCVSRYPCPRRRVSCQHSKFASFHRFLHGKKR